MGDLALPDILPLIADRRLETRKFANLLAALRARRRRSIEINHRPFDATIDLTTTCQLKCPYCAVGNGTMERPVSLMGRPLYDRLMSDIGEEVFIIWYFSTGEPLLHKQLSALLTSSKRHQIFSIISTNLSIPLSDDRLDALLKCGLGMISVSLDGATEQTYRQYRVGGHFDLVISNVNRLVQRKRELGLDFPLIEWRFLRFQHNEHEEDAARAMAKRLGVDLLEFYPGSAPPAAKDNEVQSARFPLKGPAISGPALDKAAMAKRSTLDGFLRTELNLPRFVSRSPRVHKCDWHYLSTMIYPSGSVGPCCVSNDLGDDFTTMDEHNCFVDAWNCRSFQQARESFISGVKSNTICDRCPLPAAQTYQFVQKLRAALRIAPDWVLKVLDAAPHDFFYEIDQELMPQEVGSIMSGRLGESVAMLRSNVFPEVVDEIKDLDIFGYDRQQISELASAV